jgi:hypothetical protein
MAELNPGQRWPIAPWGAAATAWRENDAWYTGNTAALAAIYSSGSPANRATHAVRGVPHEGGLVGTVAAAAHRTFWGRPVAGGEDRTRLHIPAAADLASLSSDLLFSRAPRISYGTDDDANTKAADRLDLIMSSDESHAAMQEGGEYAAAFGATGMVLRWDEETADHVWWEPVAADVTIPEFRLGRLVALNCWTEWRDGNSARYYRHVERHEPGAIFHTLYLGTADSLGMIVPLNDHPDTVQYASLVNEDGLIPTGIPVITAEWWRNMPAKDWRKRGVLAEAGRSDYTGGTKGLFDALDEAWSSWMRDLRLGKARLVIPEAYLQSNGRGRGASFDQDQELFSPLNLPGVAQGTTDQQLSQVQFDIRVAEHEQTTQALYRRILASAGYGELDKDSTTASDKTATEVNAQGQSKDRTRDRKVLYARPALASLARKAMLLDGAVFPGKGGGDLPMPEVVFPPAAVINPLQSAQTISLLRAAKVQSLETSIKMQHPEWSQDDVDDEVERLAKETPAAPDPATFGGTPPGVDPATEADPDSDPGDPGD